MQYFISVKAASCRVVKMFQLSSLTRKGAGCRDLLNCAFGLKDFEQELFFMLSRDAAARWTALQLRWRATEALSTGLFPDWSVPAYATGKS